jgi:5-methylcytosine-specific restriction endonuclease McrA
MAGRDPRLGTPEWRRLRRLILDRDLGLCQIRADGCTRYAVCVDHIVARADGGDCWQPTNLRAACRSCNSRGGAQHTNLRRQARYQTTLADSLTRM